MLNCTRSKQQQVQYNFRMVFHITFLFHCRTWPVQVNLRAQDLKKELESVVHNGRCILDGKGSSW